MNKIECKEVLNEIGGIVLDESNDFHYCPYCGERVYDIKQI